MTTERNASMAEELLEKYAKEFQSQLIIAVCFAFDEGLRRREYDYSDNHYAVSPWLNVLSKILEPALLAAERQGYESYQRKAAELEKTVGK